MELYTEQQQEMDQSDDTRTTTPSQSECINVHCLRRQETERQIAMYAKTNELLRSNMAMLKNSPFDTKGRQYSLILQLFTDNEKELKRLEGQLIAVIENLTSQ
ncbi:hypothetical protein NPIL_483311 [Nephila pilipes]|uniref:Uncharacterized protein n=1 Tax=Nephila pilipes TaxID=299642 RepID=A0A8X6TY88_NEPPI|nr:hypothetical protein NPIL_483311 [Nephila pilipes]